MSHGWFNSLVSHQPFSSFCLFLNIFSCFFSSFFRYGVFDVLVVWYSYVYSDCKSLLISFRDKGFFVRGA